MMTETTALPVGSATPATVSVGSVNLLTDVITKDRVLPAGYDGCFCHPAEAGRKRAAAVSP